MTTTLAIEHCETRLSDWLTLEYTHAANVWKNHTLFTNVKSTATATRLRQLGTVTNTPANQYLAGKHCLILDPKATTPLSPDDFKKLDAIIIGGILGFKNPRGRTKTLISDHSIFETRHIGPTQLTIDGAAVVAKAISLGMNLKDIEIAYEVEITHDPVHSTILPFGYPVFEGKPIITPGLLDYLTKK
jgi:ribosome biogenesis SPOUT family RNA methylase Rps3